MTTDLPPDSDEFELSLFGPGVGECIVIHMGGGQWLVVDSCIDPQKKQPIALSYFARLGIDAAGAVSLFVVTHWHDDHMAGAAEVLDKAVSAGFVCSVALKADEFSTVVGQAQDLMTRDSDVAEMARVFDILIERRASHTSATSAGPTKWAGADMRLFQRSGTLLPNAEVWSLSPSSASITRALNEFSRMVPDMNSGKNHLPRQQANDVAVALFVQVGDFCALLGSDLQSNTASDRGWRAVVASSTRPQGRAQVFKVSHHGSDNAHHQDVWRLMLESSPVAVLTPFASGAAPLPTAKDQKRLVALSKHAYCTAPPRGWSATKKGQPVDRMIQTARNVRAIDPKLVGTSAYVVAS